jgi:hypothetical protein
MYSTLNCFGALRRDGNQFLKQDCFPKYTVPETEQNIVLWMFLAAPSFCRIKVSPVAERSSSPFLGYVARKKTTDILEETLYPSAAEITRCHIPEICQLLPVIFLPHLRPLNNTSSKFILFSISFSYVSYSFQSFILRPLTAVILVFSSMPDPVI